MKIVYGRNNSLVYYKLRYLPQLTVCNADKAVTRTDVIQIQLGALTSFSQIILLCKGNFSRNLYHIPASTLPAAILRLALFPSGCLR